MMSKIKVAVAPKLLDAGSTTTKRIHYMGDLWPPRLPLRWQM